MYTSCFADRIRRTIALWIVLFILQPFIFARSVQQKGTEESRKLEAGRSIERELAAGQSHIYEVALTAGQYLKVIVEQRGINLAVTTVGPDGEEMFTIDGNETKQGAEEVSIAAESTNVYKLRVAASQKASPASYEIRVVEMRAATQREQALHAVRVLATAARKLRIAGKYDEALSVSQRSLAINEKAFGPEHPNVASALIALSIIYLQKGDYGQAETGCLRALAIREKALGSEHPLVASVLSNLANVYNRKGDYARARPLYLRVLAFQEKSLGPEHLDITLTLNNLAIIYIEEGDYDSAKSLYVRALDIQEKALPPEHLDIAVTLHNLAIAYSEVGDYVRAEPLYLRALAISEKVFGPEHPDIAATLGSLAILYNERGDYDKAESLYLRVLAVQEKALGPEHPAVASALNNLATLYNELGNYSKVEPLHLRALAIREKAFGPEHPNVAVTLNNLANLYYNEGDYARAEPLYLRALAIREKMMGQEHPVVASTLGNMANLYNEKGDYTRAESLHLRTLAIHEKALGQDHPNVAVTLNKLANLYREKGDYARAISHQSRAVLVSERNVERNIAIGSERQKLAYLATLSGEFNNVLTLHTRYMPDDAAGLRLALSTILQRKGRALDAMTDVIAALRRRLNPQDQSLLDQLAAARKSQAKLVLDGPGNKKPADHQNEIKQLEAKVDNLEDQISRHSVEFRAQSQPVTLEKIQAVLPPNAALVEFAVYNSVNSKKSSTENQFTETRYVAYVLGRQGEARWIDLGEARAIDDAVTLLRESLRDPGRKDVRQRARTVDEKVMRPVRRLLGQTSRVLLSPDGSLNLIPFAALVDEHNRYLVSRYSFTYLTSGRDLLRLQEKLPATHRPIIIANPDFGQRTSASTGSDSDGRRWVDFSKAYFEPLPGTQGEARALQSIFPDAQILTGQKATEAAVKQAAAPPVLHLATHGFFLEDVYFGSQPRESRGLIKTKVQERQLENPLLRSGLALAGANARRSGDDDGILTALEASGLNLWGTRLVILSACDTGVGEVRNGNGVFGLRRALMLAGSETQVMSLWPVSDEGTRDLMIEYYKGLKRGEGRTEALRQVQLKMLASRKQQHPYYWASFIQSGEWANLDGVRKER